MRSIKLYFDESRKITGRYIKMQKREFRKLCLGVGFLLAFILWTFLVIYVDVKEIGPNGSSVGFATLNAFVHERIGTNFLLYTVTDWLGLVPIGVAFGFAVLGLIQWIRRKSLWKVDTGILLLGVFYMVVILGYIFFELITINYRPVLIDGYLEGSYPSSTTMLVSCVMPTAKMQGEARIKNKVLRRVISGVIVAFTAFMIIGRLVSGVHWFSDIIGGILLSAGLVTVYDFFQCLAKQK